MDIFKLLAFIDNNRKNIIRFNHFMMILVLIKTAWAMNTGEFENYPDFYIWSFTFQIIVFVVLYIRFGED